MEQAPSLQITLHQDDPEQLAALKQILEEELDTQVSQTKQTASKGAQTKSPDWAGVTALVLAVPGAALAIKDLTDRLNKKKKVEKALQRIKKKVKTTQVKVSITYPDGRTKTVEKSTTTEILDQYDHSHS